MYGERPYEMLVFMLNIVIMAITISIIFAYSPSSALKVVSPLQYVLVDEIWISFHEYLRYSHNCGTIVFSIPRTIL